MEVLRSGSCPESMFYQQAVSTDEALVAGNASDIEDVVEIDDEGKPAIKKRPAEEIEARRQAKHKILPEIPLGQQPANITNDQLDELLDRIAKFEAKG